MIRFIGSCLVLIFCIHSFAGDPDNFSGRNTPPQNEMIDEAIQEKLKLIVETHNAKNEKQVDCDKQLLDALMTKTFDRNFPNVYDIFDKVQMDGPSKIEKSVLDGQILSILYAPSITLQKGNKTFSVGVDKIDHFFSHSYLYWKAVGEDATLPEGKVRRALKLGMDQEDGPWGLKGSGVKSYADLEANYRGIYFWRDLWNGKPPYFKCVDGKIILSRLFKIEQYITAGFDEAINCSSYKNKEFTQHMLEATKKLNLKCPIDPSECTKLVKATPEDYREYLIHPLCRGQAHNQTEEANSMTAKDVMDTAAALTSVGNLFTIFFPNKPDAHIINKKTELIQGIQRGIFNPIPEDKKEGTSR